MESIHNTTGDYFDWIEDIYTIRELHGNLIIKASPDTHREILALLSNLSQSQVAHYQRQAVLIEVFILLKQAEDHRLNQDYDAALGFIQKALAVDPQNPEAIALKEVITNTQSRE